MHGPVSVPAPDGGTDMHVTLLDAPAGGGKTFIIVQTVRRARADGRRVLVVTPGNDQLGELARRVQHALAADGLPGRTVVLHAQGRLRDDVLSQLTAAGVATVTRGRDAVGAAVVIATLHKVATTRYGYHPHDLGATGDPFGLALVDEAYQASAGVLAGTAELCHRLLLVGDPGQLKPFTTDLHATQWRGSVEDPVQSAGAMVLARHGGSIPRFQLPITRRLPATALPVVRHFYRGHHFEGWTLPQTRQVDTSVPTLAPSAPAHPPSADRRLGPPAAAGSNHGSRRPGDRGHGVGTGGRGDHDLPSDCVRGHGWCLAGPRTGSDRRARRPQRSASRRWPSGDSACQILFLCEGGRQLTVYFRMTHKEPQGGFTKRRLGHSRR